MRETRRALVFIDVKPGREKKILDSLLQYAEVLEAHYVAGEYDILVLLEIDLHGKGIISSAQEIITKFIIDKIRSLNGVQDTNTIIPTYSVIKRK
jgi:DNA-binding Lrp family transcriptional regulator